MELQRVVELFSEVRFVLAGLLVELSQVFGGGFCEVFGAGCIFSFIVEVEDSVGEVSVIFKVVFVVQEFLVVLVFQELLEEVVAVYV